VHPVTVVRGRYMPPAAPGYSAEMKNDSLAIYEYPNGPAWVRHAEASEPAIGR